MGYLTYSQSKGELRYVTDQADVLLGVGYAGNGVHINRPLDEWRVRKGPLPRGAYRISDPYRHARLGPVTFRLDPETRETTDRLRRYGRSAFRIHGDNAKGDRSASEGCIILNRPERDKIARIVADGYRSLIVTP